jgi:hypothetical protein
MGIVDGSLPAARAASSNGLLGSDAQLNQAGLLELFMR